ncbi:MAG: hypothetical protein KKF46_03020 [Nanoarchaeota archaeon]|nr:hypothetical protein [Nanoarchaeota archaeon]MBU1321305.1 hypothetical protein [Nanoarchaeota archaeon]MBU1597296.1 hypothetical protein [Nanoarchaeota archaeon]MBU2441589.1 hypothetical protein [Nanoarchaeota archaeon]
MNLVENNLYKFILTNNMNEFNPLEKKKKKHLFKDLEVNPHSDHPVHEEFVDEEDIREYKKRIREEEE